jgi:hypothetical protein
MNEMNVVCVEAKGTNSSHHQISKALTLVIVYCESFLGLKPKIMKTKLFKWRNKVEIRLFHVVAITCVRAFDVWQ